LRIDPVELIRQLRIQVIANTPTPKRATGGAPKSRRSRQRMSKRIPRTE
jgi:hypothetical protein